MALTILQLRIVSQKTEERIEKWYRTVPIKYVFIEKQEKYLPYMPLIQPCGFSMNSKDRNCLNISRVKIFSLSQKN